MSVPLLELRDVHAYYGRSHVLYGVSLTARQGEIVTLLGRTGAGKSTTLKSVVGLVDVTGGAIEFEGRRSPGLPPTRSRGSGSGSCRRTFGLFPKLRELARQRGGSLSGGRAGARRAGRGTLSVPRPGQ